MVWEWKNGSEPHIYLIDFGVCAMIKDCAKEWGIDFNISGTDTYMAPEAWQYQLSEDPTVADSWSAGIMFAELVSEYLNRFINT